MSTYMRMYHGRKDVIQNAAYWGEEGPLLMGLKSVNYDLGNVLLEFKDDEARQSAMNKVDWIFSDLVTPNSIDYRMLVNFATPHGYSEFLKVEQSGKPTMYYSDFKIAHEPLQEKLRMRLFVEKAFINKYPHLPKEFIIEGIEELYFHNGFYEIIFSEQVSAFKAQNQTGWIEGVAPFRSLEMPINSLGQIVVPGAKLKVSEAVEFSSFILSL